MHAVVVKVTVNDEEAAEKSLREQVVPGVSQAPGFMRWILDSQGQQWPLDDHRRVRGTGESTW